MTRGWIVVAALVLATGCGGKKKTSATENSPGSGSVMVAADAAPQPDAAAPAAKPETATQTIDVPFMVDTKKVKVSAKVPVGWIRRDPLPTWDPPNANDLPMWHQSYEISATCDGGCTAKELTERVPKLLDAIKAKHIKPKMSGDPVKDENTLAPVKELERGDLPQGGSFLLLRVEKPVGSTDPYPDMFAGVCITRRPTDELMVITNIRAEPEAEKTWWPVLVDACKATTIDPATPAAP
jgi:hypothetical protein